MEELLQNIQNKIVANNNNEISADILRPILIDIVNYVREEVGDLADLNTTEKTDIVTALNELIGDNESIKVLSGSNDPRVTAPPSFSIGDFYIWENSGIQGFFQYNGIEWLSTDANGGASQTAAEIVALIDQEIGNDAWKTKVTDEHIQDIVGAMFQAGTHSNISIQYDDVNGVINLTAQAGGTGGTTLTDEQVQDIVGGFNVSGSGINATYDDEANQMIFSLTGESFTTALKNKLNGISAGAQVNSITGVKGSAETIFRTGQVSISLANLDAGTTDPLITYTTARDS